MFLQVLPGSHSLRLLARCNNCLFIEFSPPKDFCNDAPFVAAIFKGKKMLFVLFRLTSQSRQKKETVLWGK